MSCRFWGESGNSPSVARWFTDVHRLFCLVNSSAVTDKGGLPVVGHVVLPGRQRPVIDTQSDQVKENPRYAFSRRETSHSGRGRCRYRGSGHDPLGVLVIESAEFIRNQIAGASVAVLDAAHISNMERPDDYARTVLGFLQPT